MLDWRLNTMDRELYVMRRLILAGAMCAAFAAAVPANAAQLLPPDDPTIHVQDSDGNKFTINYGDVNGVVYSIESTIGGQTYLNGNVYYNLPDNMKITFFPDRTFTLSPGEFEVGYPTTYRLKIGTNGREVLSFPTGAENSLTIVPEPATWAMMLMGLLGVGGALRSRRRWAALTA